MTALAAINRSALAANLSLARQVAPNSRIMAVVKANAYGHGLIETVAGLEADAVAVAHLGEGRRLRQAGAQQSICLLSADLNKNDLQEAEQLNLDLVIHCDDQLNLLANTRFDKTGRLGIWLKFNTGMNRLGFAGQLREQIEALLLQRRDIAVRGIMSHFACADDLANAMTERQISEFKGLIGPSELPDSIANSAGVIAWPASRLQWVRPGIMIYGISPFPPGPLPPSVQQIVDQLRPVMTLSSQLIAVQRVRRGETVGYGAAWRAETDSIIGIVGIGYGDGYPRHAGPGTQVLVEGTLCPLVGRVSMDMLAVDLSQCPQVTPGSQVILWGPDLPVAEVAATMDTIAYTLVTGLTGRVDYRYSSSMEIEGTYG